MASVEEGVSVVTVGRTQPIPAGQAVSANSLPVVISSDQSPIPIIDNLSAPSQVRDDLLGFPRVQTPLAIFDDTNLIDINPDIWASSEEEIGGVKVTQVNHILQQSASEIKVTPSAANGTSATLITKQNFPYQTGRITCASFGVSFNVNTSARMEFGMFNSSDGYFIRIQGSELYYVRRTSSGERPQDHLKGYTGQGTDPTTFTVNADVLAEQPKRIDFGTTYQVISSSPNVMEEVVPRKYWNGDTMVGENGASLIGVADSLSKHELSMSNLVMARIEFGWYGGTGSRLMFYVPIDANLPTGETVKTARWLVAHNLNCSDRIPFPSLGNPTLPMQFLTQKTGVLTTDAYLRKYGAQITIDGGDYSKLDIFSADSSKRTDIDLTLKPLIAMRVKENIVNNQSESSVNQLRVFPLLASLVSTSKAQFVLVKNPDTMTDTLGNPVTTFTSTGTLSAIEINSPDSATNAFSSFTGGKQVAAFFTGDNASAQVELDQIFSFAREFLSREATATAGEAGDVLVIAAASITDTPNTCKASLTWGQR
jgi:hypothetical protein